MKKHIILMISLLLITPLIAVGSLGAVANEDGSTSSRPAEGEVTVTNTPEQPGEATDKAKIEERVEKRRKDRNFRIPFAEQVKVKERCKNSQGKLSSLSGRIKGIETSRTKRHANLLDRLNKVAETLKQKDIDTAELEAQITVLKTHFTGFDSELAAYKLVVSDLALMDCQPSPVGFRASLEVARESRTKTLQSSQAVKVYLRSTIKPTLQQLRSQVNASQSTGQEN